jgi:hypothetical protein
MILVRDIFQLHFGKAKEAVALAKKGRELERRAGYNVSRLLTDVTGPYYTLVMESEVESLAALESALAEASQNEDWRDWYARFVPLVREGQREVFRVVEVPEAVAGAEMQTGVRGL